MLFMHLHEEVLIDRSLLKDSCGSVLFVEYNSGTFDPALIYGQSEPV